MYIAKSDCTCGRDIKVDRNSRTGIAICTVADILLKFNRT